jgi:hypothetical protein
VPAEACVLDEALAYRASRMIDVEFDPVVRLTIEGGTDASDCRREPGLGRVGLDPAHG